MFYGWNYPALLRNPNTMPHYVFYEMGRNFYTLGDRHSAFTTGFAVFMRYVCMDTLGCVDEDDATRRTIEGVEPLIRASGLSFLKIFTNCDGLSEKEPRVRDKYSQWINPSDQPVTYASAMLRLWRENGRNAWVKRFFRALAECPEARGNERASALTQRWNWLVSASVAANKDLTPVFADDWHLPLSETTRKELSTVNWSDKGLSVATINNRFVSVREDSSAKHSKSDQDSRSETIAFKLYLNPSVIRRWRGNADPVETNAPGTPTCPRLWIVGSRRMGADWSGTKPRIGL